MVSPKTASPAEDDIKAGSAEDDADNKAAPMDVDEDDEDIPEQTQTVIQKRVLRYEDEDEDE